MYSSKKNVQVLISLLKAHGVRHAVLSPGSRNMAIVASLENDPDFTCYSVVDERSAAYFAIGISLAHQAPVALSCTSAQATRNYIPGMTEAYYRGTPLVFITADYKRSQIGQGVMQALDQMSIPADAAKVSVNLPLVKSTEDENYCSRLVNEALLELDHHGTGPVHINIPIEEHWEGGVRSLPPANVIARHTSTTSMPDISGRKIMIAVGQHFPFGGGEAEALSNFAERHDAVVYTNHLSNYHGKNAVQASLVLPNVDNAHLSDLRPDLLITIGGQIGDYDFDDFTRKIPFEHWRVHPDGKIQDTYGKLSAVFEMGEEEFFRSYLDGRSESSTGYADSWVKASSERVTPKKLPFSQAYVASELSARIPANSSIHFAILNAFRNWSLFEMDPSIDAYCNVAGFGIDGCLSTFLGHSVATEKLCFLVIGDLSFFYDMGAAGIRGLTSNARIILVNNNGGAEFRLYSNAAERSFGEGADKHIAAAGHFGSARAWVESMGWGYRAIRTKKDLKAGAEWLLSDSDRPLIMEVFTTSHDDSEGVRMMREANTVLSLKKRIASTLPPGVKRTLKSVLTRQG
ncbi:MAG: thiamine pyrophosphate-binding protein [Ancrocorticia sp.]